MQSDLTSLRPGQLVITNQTITAYPTSSTCYAEQHKGAIWKAVPKGAPLMVMSHFVDSTCVHSHYHPDELLFREILIFLYDNNFYFITGSRPPMQKGSTLLGNRVTLHTNT